VYNVPRHIIFAEDFYLVYWKVKEYIYLSIFLIDTHISEQIALDALLQKLIA
jgi:hypothetical protein